MVQRRQSIRILRMDVCPIAEPISYLVFITFFRSFEQCGIRSIQRGRLLGRVCVALLHVKENVEKCPSVEQLFREIEPLAVAFIGGVEGFHRHFCGDNEHLVCKVGHVRGVHVETVPDYR